MVSIIVSVFNPPELTANFLSWMADYVREGMEIILVCDGDDSRSTRFLLRQAKREKARLKVVFRKFRSGYAAANNQGVGYSSGEFLVFLNCDAFPEKGSIQRLVDYLKRNPQVGVAQGLLLLPQNARVQSTGHIFGSFLNRHALAGRHARLDVVRRTVKRQALTSAFCAVRRSDFLALGGFDEFYFNCFEGMEFTLKMHLAGRQCVYRPDALAYHIQGSSRRRAPFDEEQQAARFWALWGTKIRRDLDGLLLEQLTRHQRSRRYLRVNASSYRSWDDTLDALGLKSEEVASISPIRPITLQETLVPAIHRSRSPVLFLTNHFSEVSDNLLWYQARPKREDLILDCHGNALTMEEILG